MGESIGNPAGAFGQTASAPQQTEDLLALNAIAAGEVVAASTSEGVGFRNLAATARGIQIGIAKRAALSGASVTVVTGGYVTAAKGTAAMTAGELVVADNTVSGAVRSLSTATAVTVLTDLRGIIGTVAATASAAATTALIYVGKF